MKQNNVSLALAILLAFFMRTCTCATNYYPSSITDITSTHSSQPIACLAVQDQSTYNDTWAKYIEFDANEILYSGIIFFTVPQQIITEAVLTVNFRGQPFVHQQWRFDIFQGPDTWLFVGNTNPNTKGWLSWNVFTYTIPSSVDFTNVISAQNNIQIRFSAGNALDTSQLDFVQLTLTST